MSKQPFEYVRRWDAKREQKGWWHSFELPDGTRIDGVHTLQSSKDRIAQFPIPQDLRGKRVLDIGTWDGWFAFEMERRGADVVAVDNWDNPRFRQMHSMVDSRIEYRKLDIYELTPERIGLFDIVLFMGVLYHLKHPLLALERVCALTTEMAAVDSFILREEHRPGIKVDRRPIMEFYETTEFGGQTDNWVGPSLPCLLAFCRTAGFARAELRSVIEYSACVACYRKWQPPAPDAPASPQLLNAFHVRDYGINFSSHRDEYVAATLRCPLDALTLDDVKPEVGGYGVRPVEITASGPNEFQAGFKLPPGLTAGMHDVRIRIRDSGPGNACRIAVDMPLDVDPPRIKSLSDGTTWMPNQLDPSKGDVLSVWLSGLPENADRNNLHARLGIHPLKVAYIEEPGPESRQVNLQVPEDLAPGSHNLQVSFGTGLMNGPGLPVHIIHQ